jgi:hypothetical protein
MRFGVWATAVVCAAWAAGPAHAQMGSASTILGGPPPSAIVQRPIDMSHVIAPTTGMSAQQSRFNFSSIFSKLVMPTYPIKRGISPLPPPSAFPTFPDFKMVGKPPYQLGDQRAAKNPFQPLPPIIPNTKTPVGPGSR